MIRHRIRHLVNLLVPVVLLVGGPAIAAQEAKPAGSSDGITLAASGLDNPRGFTWAPDGTLYIAQAGSSPAHDDMAGATPDADDAFVGTLDGSVVRITNGCPDIFQGNLPSAGHVGGSELGPASVAILNGQVYVLDEGGGAAHDNPLTPDGIYAIDGDGSARLVADIGSWVEENPVSDPSGDGDIVAMIAAGGALWVVESNNGQLLRVTPDGEIERIADLSEGNVYPHGIAAAPDGSFFVSFLTSAPYVDGAAKVVNITADGIVTDAWTGLTAVTDVAIGPDGTLYALQLGTPAEAPPLSVMPDTGKVLRQTGPESAEEVAVNIDAPLAMLFGPDQGLYVSTPAIVSQPGYGAVIRLNLTQGQVMTMSETLLAESPCLPDPTPTPDPSPDPTPDAENGTPQPATPDPAGDESSVEIDDFAYGPDMVTVDVGATVTWTNNDSAPHTVKALDGSFDSGNIAPGETFTYTFTNAGTFDYTCSYHPNMTATVVVE